MHAVCLLQLEGERNDVHTRPYREIQIILADSDNIMNAGMGERKRSMYKTMMTQSNPNPT